MRRRELTLLDGLRIGGTVAKSVTVREGTLGDTLKATGAGHAGLRLDLAIAMARIERIGDLDAPGDGVLALMTQRDWMLIDRALLEIDAEGLRDLEATGLLQPQGGGGRDEPGPAAPVTPPPGNA